MPISGLSNPSNKFNRIKKNNDGSIKRARAPFTGSAKSKRNHPRKFDLIQMPTFERLFYQTESKRDKDFLLTEADIDRQVSIINQGIDSVKEQLESDDLSAEDREALTTIIEGSQQRIEQYGDISEHFDKIDADNSGDASIEEFEAFYNFKATWEQPDLTSEATTTSNEQPSIKKRRRNRRLNPSKLQQMMMNKHERAFYQIESNADADYLVTQSEISKQIERVKEGIENIEAQLDNPNLTEDERENLENILESNQNRMAQFNGISSNFDAIDTNGTGDIDIDEMASFYNFAPTWEQPEL